MNEGSKQTIGWGTVVLAILVALTAWFDWGDGWQYLWAVLIAILGLWAAFAPSRRT